MTIPEELEPEDEDHLEQVAEVQRYAPPFPPELLQTDPLWARDVIQRAKKDARERTIPPHPEPEVRARPAEDNELSRSSKAFVALLEQYDWLHSTTYARGSAPGSWQRESPDDEHTVWTVKVVDLIAVAAARDRDCLVATWEDGKSRAAYWNTIPVSVTELNYLVTQFLTPDEVTTWLHNDREARKRARAPEEEG